MYSVSQKMLNVMIDLTYIIIVINSLPKPIQRFFLQELNRTMGTKDR